jgi:hypothetical protein
MTEEQLHFLPTENMVTKTGAWQILATLHLFACSCVALKQDVQGIRDNLLFNQANTPLYQLFFENHFVPFVPNYMLEYKTCFICHFFIFITY